jgi:EAL domain-containing protein (putative c-di-GMP-specific phosphodiesterase class I)
MGLSVVAEGVETRSQLAVLRRLGCDLAQGYLYSPAVEGVQVARLVAEGTAGGMPV